MEPLMEKKRDVGIEVYMHHAVLVERVLTCHAATTTTTRRERDGEKGNTKKSRERKSEVARVSVGVFGREGWIDRGRERLFTIF
jgi:hypothetical protein